MLKHFWERALHFTYCCLLGAFFLGIVFANVGNVANPDGRELYICGLTLMFASMATFGVEQVLDWTFKKKENANE